jgi:uncharacterized Rmd1/YagE family protein
MRQQRAFEASGYSCLRLTCSCRSYRLPELMKFFNARRTSYHTNPKLLDEAIYTPYAYDPPSANQYDNRRSRSKQSQTADLLGIPELVPEEPRTEENARRTKKKSKFDATPTEAEIFLFNYGTVVIWGMTEAQEKRFLTSM